MRADTIDSELNNLLSDGVSVQFTPAMRQTAISAAVREYSRYSPLSRRFGTASMYTDEMAGPAYNNEILVVGGVYYAGQVIGLSYFTPMKEYVTITQVENDPDLSILGTSLGWNAGSPVALTLIAALQRDHKAGDIVRPDTIGLNIIAGQDTYLLPKDFISPDTQSFNIATGLKLSYSRQGGFYDAAYSIASRYSSRGMGETQNSGYSNVNGLAGVGQNGLVVPSMPAVLYRFVDADTPQLIISPTPVANQTLDFFYNASHTLGSIPERDMTLLLHYAQFSIKQAKAAAIGSELDYSEDDSHETGSSNANALQKQAADHLKEWDRCLRNKPILISG